MLEADTPSRATQLEVADPVCHPPRFKWLRRYLVTIGVIVLFLGGIHVVLDAVSKRRLGRLARSVQAMAAPRGTGDVTAAKVDPSTNAATYYNNACDLLGSRLRRRLGRRVMTPSILLAASPALDCSTCVFPTPQMSQQARAYGWPSRRLSGLASLVENASREGRESGSYQHAVHLLRLAQDLSDRIGLVDDSVHGWNFAAVHRIQTSRLTARLVRVLPSLEADPPTRWFPDAVSEELALLAAALADETPIERDWRVGVYAARVDLVAQGQSMGTFADFHFNARWPVSSGWKQMVRFLSVPSRRFEVVRRAGAMGSWSFPYVPDPSETGALGRFDQWTRDAEQDLSTGHIGSLQPKHQLGILARRRLAAVGVAYTCYLLDEGVAPAALEDLVPRYLPAIPSDPFTLSNEPIGFGAGDDLPRRLHAGALQFTLPALAP